jgi:hypothetical protein
MWRPASEPPGLPRDPSRPQLEPIGEVEVEAEGTLYDGRPWKGRSVWHKGLTEQESWWEGPLMGTIARWRNPRVLRQA